MGKNDVIKVDAQQYGIILSEIILINGDSYPEFCKSIEIKQNFLDYLQFLEYLVYISKKIIEKEYSNIITSIVINSCLESIIDCLQNIKQDSKAKFKNYIKEQYKFIENKNYDVFDKLGLKKLIDLFLIDLKLEKDVIIEQHVMIEFSNFIKYNAETILNKEIIINE